MSGPLPIYALEGDLLDRLRETPRLILSAPTGSGKSTQVPQMLLKHGLLGQGQVIVLQPRRLAARLLAARVSEELGTELGREVGYQVRFENVASAATRIKFVTEGILLRRMIDDPLQQHLMLPTVTEVVFVDELESLAPDELIQAVTLLVLQILAIAILFFGFAI